MTSERNCIYDGGTDEETDLAELRMMVPNDAWLIDATENGPFKLPPDCQQKVASVVPSSGPGVPFKRTRRKKRRKKRAKTRRKKNCSRCSGRQGQMSVELTLVDPTSSSVHDDNGPECALPSDPLDVTQRGDEVCSCRQARGCKEILDSLVWQSAGPRNTLWRARCRLYRRRLLQVIRCI